MDGTLHPISLFENSDVEQQNYYLNRDTTEWYFVSASSDKDLSKKY